MVSAACGPVWPYGIPGHDDVVLPSYAGRERRCTLMRQRLFAFAIVVFWIVVYVPLAVISDSPGL